MRKMVVTQALNELKLYDSKISKAISNSTFVGSAVKSSDMINGITKDEFQKRATSSFESVTDLIKNRNALKAAIVKSNAETEVTIDGKTMTRAEAIERKSSIGYEQDLLTTMKDQLSYALSDVEKHNIAVDKKVDELLLSLVGRDSSKKLSDEDQAAVEKPYRNSHEYAIVDPLKLQWKIDVLEKDIQGFESNVDTALTISNATTYIEVDF